jgi:uroporphyrinogen III methyltransferase/synthase
VKNFLALLYSRNRDIGRFTKKPIIACIGPIAARAAQESGMEVDIIAKEYTIDGLVAAIKEFNNEL